MRRVPFVMLWMIFIVGCTPAAVQPSAASVHTPAATRLTGTAIPTLSASPTTPTPEPTTEGDPFLNIADLKMVDAKHAWALVYGNVLSRNAILRTEDAGRTWQDVTPPQVITLRNDSYWFSGSLVGFDAKTAWLVTNGAPDEDRVLFTTVWRTEDGGRSWGPGNPITIYKAGRRMSINGFNTKLNFADAEHGWLRARVEAPMGQYFDTWFQTVDGGLHWRRLLTGCGRNFYCYYFFVDETTGFRHSPNPTYDTVAEIEASPIWQIEKTANGGVTWSKVQLTPPSDLSAELFSGQDAQPSDVSSFTIRQALTRFPSGAIGFRLDFSAHSAGLFKPALFEKGYYFISEDKGQTWQSFPFSGDLFFLTESMAWKFSERNSAYLLEKTSDGGATWSPVGKEVPEVGRLQFADENTGWMLIPDKVMRLARTLDGGQTWTDITSPIWEALLSNRLPEIPVVGSSPIPAEPWLARMEAGSPLVLHKIDMFDANQGWGTSLNGYIFHTTDGGRSWQDVTPPYGTAVSDRGFVAVDAARAWTVVMPLAVCIDDRLREACPDYYLTYGPVWYTEDGGKTWSPGGPLPDPERTFQTKTIDIRFANEALGWAQWLSRDPNGNGAINHVMETSDGGRTWTPLINEHYEGDTLFLNELIGFRSKKMPVSVSVQTIDEFMAGAALPLLEITRDHGMTWKPIALPRLIFNLDDPRFDENRAFDSYCYYPEISFFGPHSVAVDYPCWMGDAAEFSEYYYSMDGGQSWNNWISNEYLYNTSDLGPAWEMWMQSANEFFLENGVGWRLYKSGPDSLTELQHTIDGGKTWETINTAAWQEATFDFIDEQQGWAIAVNGDETALIHTRDGGRNWKEIEPVVVSE